MYHVFWRGSGGFGEGEKGSWGEVKGVWRGEGWYLNDDISHEIFVAQGSGGANEVIVRGVAVGLVESVRVL